MNSPEIEEQSQADVYSNLPSGNGSSTVKSNRSSSRSKHSETEQRRRIKINERYQSLMDIIPQNQNDQKRDKASFLLEVIEYIQFLQEKVQMYEASHQMWYQAPTKLIPWRNNHGSVAEVSDQPQIVTSFLSNDKVSASSCLLSDMQNSVDPVIDSAPSTRIFERNPISAFSSCMLTEPLLQFVQHDFWQPKQSFGSIDCSKDKLLNSDEKVSASLSTVYSERVLHSLTEDLKSSGVNISETKISVQLGLRKRTDHEYSVTAFASEGNCNTIPDEEDNSPTEIRSLCKELDHSQKRIRL